MGSVTEPAPGEYGPPEPGVDQGGERDTSGDHGFLGQPRPLVHIFGVEMWERFSFYGMQGILLLYLYYSAVDGGLGMDQTDAAGIVGAYGGAVYLSTILGAWIADRLHRFPLGRMLLRDLAAGTCAVPAEQVGVDAACERCGLEHDLLRLHATGVRSEIAQQHPPEEEPVEAVVAREAGGAGPLGRAQQPERAVAVQRRGSAPSHAHAAVELERLVGRTAPL